MIAKLVIGVFAILVAALWGLRLAEWWDERYA